MKQLTFAIVVGITFVAIDVVTAVAQEAPHSWIPLSAKLTRRIWVDLPGEGTVTVGWEGIYARDSQGRIFNRATLTHPGSPTPVRGSTDTGTIRDLPGHILYMVNYSLRRYYKRKMDPSLDKPEPQTGDEFDKLHAGETYLGKQVISGVECEGYQVPVPKYKKHFNETWYAPSLNFLVVRWTGYNPMKQKVETLLQNIQAGTEPDSTLFLVPSGFQEVHQWDISF